MQCLRSALTPNWNGKVNILTRTNSHQTLCNNGDNEKDHQGGRSAGGDIGDIIENLLQRLDKGHRDLCRADHEGRGDRVGDVNEAGALFTVRITRTDANIGVRCVAREVALTYLRRVQSIVLL